jgi:hypothetical protein
MKQKIALKDKRKPRKKEMDNVIILVVLMKISKKISLQ